MRKAKAKTEQQGKTQEALGRATGNDRMEAGQATKSKGDAREAKEKTKDAFNTDPARTRSTPRVGPARMCTGAGPARGRVRPRCAGRRAGARRRCCRG
ncbi:hypothetical protein SALBM217S_05213 [Streptomyces griseoloalbus]